MNFQIETTSVCDLKCGYCPNKDMVRKRQFMAMDVWETILEKYVAPFKERNRHCPPTLINHKDGEPLLNKRFTEMLGIASAMLPDIKIDVYSHGLMLPTWRARGNDFISFLGSLPNKCRYLMSYHPFNHDGSKNDYAATNAYMRDMLQAPPGNVEFIMVSHLSKHVSKDELLAWRDSWTPEINRRVLTVHANVGINPWTGRIDEPGTVEFNGCPYGDFGHMFFGVTGNVIACCMDLEEEIVFGNVLTDSPDAMFAKLTEFYAEQQRIARDKTGLVHEVCRDCMGMGKRADLLQVGMKA